MRDQMTLKGNHRDKDVLYCVLINSSNYYDSYGFSHKHLLEDSVAVESLSGMVNQQLQFLEVRHSKQKT